MSLPFNGWKNKNGTSTRSCKCGTWKQHWINFSGESWPILCSISGCLNIATLGAHVINSAVSGEKITPMCESCNKLTEEFSLKDNTTLVSANVSNTCGKQLPFIAQQFEDETATLFLQANINKGFKCKLTGKSQHHKKHLSYFTKRHAKTRLYQGFQRFKL